MPAKRTWLISAGVSFGLLGLVATSGLTLLATYFIEELSKPHMPLPMEGMMWRMPALVPEPPATQQRGLMFHAANGPLLCGEFWAQAQPAPTVVICHGYRVQRADLRGIAALEYATGWNVLLFDFRGHGESESIATSGGNAEVEDLQAALAVASLQPETLPGKIIIHGFSMGAAIALLIPPYPEVVAIIADSSYARLDDILRRLIAWKLKVESEHWRQPYQKIASLFPFVAWLTVCLSLLVFRLRFGHSLMARPDRSFKRWKLRAKATLYPKQPPILLIHGTEDLSVPFSHAQQLVASARRQHIFLDTYFVEHANHCESYSKNPERYTMLLREFVSRYL